MTPNAEKDDVNNNLITDPPAVVRATSDLGECAREIRAAVQKAEMGELGSPRTYTRSRCIAGSLSGIKI